MRLLEGNNDSGYSLTKDFIDNIPRYAILSHTWGADTEEVTFKDLVDSIGKSKAGYNKIRFCGEQARRDNLRYFWVDTCCIDKSSSAELAEAINSMFRWYRDAAKCYVYLSDISISDYNQSGQLLQFQYGSAFQSSRWFTRGWTLQELLAPACVEFFSREWKKIGDKKSLESQIRMITGIPCSALQGSPLSCFSVAERFLWLEKRSTTRKEDLAYSMLGIFDIHMPLLYGEGKDKAFIRLQKKIAKSKSAKAPYESRHPLSYSPHRITKAQTSHSLASFVNETHHAFVSEEHSLQRYIAQIYRELGEQRNLIRQLKLATEQLEERRDRQATRASNCGIHVPTQFACPALKLDGAEHPDSTAVDIFFDCVSRFSADDSASSINGLCTRFSGSPDYRFETVPSFYPEQYTINGLFSDPVFVVAMKQSQEHYRTQEYFLTYAETPRRWRQVIASITFNVREQSALWQVSAPDSDEFSCKVLPKALQSFLSMLLARLEFFYSVTRLSISFGEDENGYIVPESQRVDADKDHLENSMSNEDEILQYIEHSGCPKFPESAVIVESRFNSSCYHVWVNERKCIKHTVPFARAGRDGENGFRDFCSDLKLLISLRNCPSVVEFIGVVLDDARQHLRGYLCESLMIPSLRRIFQAANLRCEIIPWPIREDWSRQIIRAISNVHSKGLVLGVLNTRQIGLRADGTAVLTCLKTSQRHISNKEGAMPPELRITCGKDTRVLQKLNFQTDIFQLGLILWLLAEHRPHITCYLCIRAGCISQPRYMCTDHANPVELPACCGDIPPYFVDIIRKCRSADPGARPTAQELVQELSHVSEVNGCPLRMHELLDTYYGNVMMTDFLVHCEECAAITRDFHYHCNVCSEGDFDLCPSCVTKGIHCWKSEHRLVKRITRNSRIVEIS